MEAFAEILFVPGVRERAVEKICRNASWIGWVWQGRFKRIMFIAADAADDDD